MSTASGYEVLSSYGDEYEENVREFIKEVNNSIVPQFIKRVTAIERTALADAINAKNANDSIKRDEKRLKDMKNELEKYRTEKSKLQQQIQDAQKQNNKNNKKTGGATVQEAKNRIIELDSKKATKEAEIKQLQSKIGTQTPPPMAKIYISALERLDNVTKEFMDSLRDEANRLMRSRDSVRSQNLENEVYGEVREALETLFQRVSEKVYALFVDKDGTLRFLQGVIKNEYSYIEEFYSGQDSSKQTEKASRVSLMQGIEEDIRYQVQTFLSTFNDASNAIVKKLSDKIDVLGSIDRFDIGVLYVLKLCRLGLAFASSFVTLRIFENAYVERMAKNAETPPDLKWMVVTFMAMQAVFDLCLIGVCYFVSSVLPVSLDSSVVKDFMVDTLAATTMTTVSVFPIADIIQDRKYFEYSVTAPRALRLMKQIMWSLTSIHAIVPYFYLTGPFYIQQKNLAAEDKAPEKSESVAEKTE